MKTPENQEGQAKSKVGQLSQHGQKLYTPKKRERKADAPLTVEQFLRKAGYQDERINDLIRAMHKSKIQSFSEWEREVSTLLKKQTR